MPEATPRPGTRFAGEVYVLIDRRVYRIDGAKVRLLEELPDESDPAP